MGSRSRIFAPKTHLPLNLPPAPQPETMADGDVSACFDAGNSFNTKLKDALSGLVKANNDRKSEIDALRGDHDQPKKDHDALEVTTTRENDLRKNEIKSLEEKQTKDNTARQMDIAKLDGKLDTENGARKAEIAALDSWAKGENEARKTEIANLKNFAESENDARKTAIANLDNFAKSENDGRKADIAALNKRADDEAAARGAEDAALNDRISKEISDRENSNQDLQNRMDSQNSDRISDIEDLKTRIERENAFLKFGREPGEPLGHHRELRPLLDVDRSVRRLRWSLLVDGRDEERHGEVHGAVRPGCGEDPVADGSRHVDLQAGFVGTVDVVEQAEECLCTLSAIVGQC